MNHISIYHSNTEAAANSPHKGLALHSLYPYHKQSQESFGQTSYQEVDQLHYKSETWTHLHWKVPAILTIKKEDKLKSFSLLTTSNNYNDRFHAQASSYGLNKPCPA